MAGSCRTGVGRGRLLEVGPGSGGFVRVALRRGWQVDATEMSETGVATLRAAAFARAAVTCSLDVLTWRCPGGAKRELASFDAQASAVPRNRVSASPPLRGAKDSLRLGYLGVGDTPLARARK